MENEARLSPRARAKYDSKRFPALWQATLATALMLPVGVAATLFAVYATKSGTVFNSEFGYDMFLALISQMIMVLAIPLFFLLVTKKDVTATLRMEKSIDFVQVLLILVACIGLFYPAQIINAFFVEGVLENIIGPQSDASSMAEAATLPQLLFSIVITCGLPAICEEVFFRGMVMRAYERKGARTAVLMSSTVFAVMHGNLTQLVYAFVLGIFLALITITADSLYASLTAHFTLNFMSSVLVFRPISDWLLSFSEQNQDLLIEFVYTVCPTIAAVGIVFFIIYTRRKNVRLYGKKYVSEMAYPKQMKKQNGWQTALFVIFWVLFVLFNILEMIVAW